MPAFPRRAHLHLSCVGDALDLVDHVVLRARLVHGLAGQCPRLAKSDLVTQEVSGDARSRHDFDKIIVDFLFDDVNGQV